ncbi:MAG: DUF2334 domain-containing protein [Gammaproteobacteria bacterium]
MRLSPLGLKGQDGADNTVSDNAIIVRRAILSVHDVMPETLRDVEAILSGPLAAFDPERILLLVVPGCSWSRGALQRLRVLAMSGYEFAGHGWLHEVKRIKGIYHFLHSCLLSRRTAEHLSLTSDEIASLLMMNADWFSEQGFAPPVLYVPPAWAIGRINAGLLRYQPFRWFEVFMGFWDTLRGHRRAVPLMGFEADTRFRAQFLSWSNQLAWRLGRTGYPIRIAIHPRDFSLQLATPLRVYLAGVEAVHWRAEFERLVG